MLVLSSRSERALAALERALERQGLPPPTLVRFVQDHGPFCPGLNRLREDGARCRQAIGAVCLEQYLLGAGSVGYKRAQITQVRVIPKNNGGTGGDPLEASDWSFDPSTSSLRIDVPVDGAREMVVALGTRVRPPQVTLPEQVDFESVRVIVGGRLGVEGEAGDYTLDRESRLLRLLGPDTPENSLRYYVQASLLTDPAHPNRGLGIAFGNHGDQVTIRRLIGIESR